MEARRSGTERPEALTGCRVNAESRWKERACQMLKSSTNEGEDGR